MASKNVPTAWIRDIADPVEQEEFVKSLRANYRVLDKVRKLLLEDLRTLDDKEAKEETYDNGYPYLQAHLNGRRQAIKHMLDYLSFLED